MKHTVMIINNIFEGDNLLIIKSKGSEIIQRYNQRIEKEMVIEYLNKTNIDMEDCLFYIVKNDWRGNPNIEKF